MVLGWGSRSRQAAAAHRAAVDSAITANSSAFAQSLSGETAESVPSQGKPEVRSVFAGLPLMFEPNLGQANLDPTDARAQFMARGSGYGLFLGSEGAILTLSSRDSSNRHARVESLQMKLAGANPNPNLTGADLLSTQSNYLLGNDPAKWKRNVPLFARVRYNSVYPGIDLIFYGTQGRLEYDFQVAPGSDPSQAELEFDGAKKVELKDGSLLIRGEGGSVRLDVPRVYQQVAGRQQPVQGSFELRANNRVGFSIGPYDHSRELVIDPVLTYSTYFGGSGDEHSTSVVVDNLGDIYLAGSTTSPNLPAATVFQTTLAGTQNVYIAKLDPTRGTGGLLYVTYLGGDGVDTPVGIGVDGAGDPFVAGTTSSSNFPTKSGKAYQTAPEAGSTGTQHVFVTELDNLAQDLEYSSYLSGNGNDIASGMTIDSKGYIYVTGTTTSNDTPSTIDQFPASTLPQALAYQSIPRAPIQFFVTKVNTNAPGTGSIAYSTYFGGGNFITTPIATGGGIAVDTNGNIYFTGTTNFTYTGCVGCDTTDFPILDAYQPCLNQAPPTVTTNPPLCPTTDTGFSDAFVTKLNPDGAQGQQLIWSTYLGGTATDSGTGIAIDAGAANIYVTGTTNSPDVTPSAIFAAYQRCLDSPTVALGATCPVVASPAASDGFLARFTNPATTTITTNVSLTYFSYLGGSGNDAGLAITVDSSNGALLTGWTQSTDFPIFPNPNAIQSQLNGTQDAFVARLNTAAVTGQNTTASWANYFGGSGIDEGTGIALDSNQSAYLAGDTNSVDLQVSRAYQPQNNGGYDAFVTELNTASTLSITGTLTLGTNQTYISAGNQATFTYILTNNGPDLASGITVSDNLNPQITGVPLSFVSATTTSGTCTGASATNLVSCTIGSLQAGSTATITIILTPTPTSSGNAVQFNGGTVTAGAANGITPVQISVSGSMSDFTLQAGPSNVTLNQAGDTATYNVQLFPHPVYATNISLSVTGLPTGATFSFTTTPVTLSNSSPGASTLNIATTARPVPLPTASLATRHFYAIWLSAPGLALFCLGAVGDRRRRRIAGVLLMCVLGILIGLQPACSSSPATQAPPSGTPAGTYPLTVTATAGSDTKNYPITLTVP
jgi:uncharacterized repeat protein (TIGR01451 family)